MIDKIKMTNNPRDLDIYGIGFVSHYISGDNYYTHAITDSHTCPYCNRDK